eukprot:895745-Prymnesium_polylepis.1
MGRVARHNTKRLPSPGCRYVHAHTEKADAGDGGGMHKRQDLAHPILQRCAELLVYYQKSHVTT